MNETNILARSTKGRTEKIKLNKAKLSEKENICVV